MAFSQLARQQMRDPLGMLTDELQALEDLLGTAAIQDATGIGGAAALGDLGGGSEWQCHCCQRGRGHR